MSTHKEEIKMKTETDLKRAKWIAFNRRPI